MQKYVEVGQMALRGPGGEFLPAIPLYIRKKDSKTTSPTSQLSVADELINHSEVIKLFAGKYKQYSEG